MVGAAATQISAAMYPDPSNLQEAVVGPEEQRLIESSYLEMCDAMDGIEDGILNDPRQCEFDVATLLCEGKQTDGCLSAEQLAAVKVVYDGPKDSRGRSLCGEGCLRRAQGFPGTVLVLRISVWW
jgi:feruloyl esterase